MQRVRLIHWNASEAEIRAGQLQKMGYEVDGGSLDAASLRALYGNPPDAVVIDLSRAPAQGRDVGVGLRMRKATRHVPLVFVEGDPRKVDRVRELLPDAVYATWADLGPALAGAMAHPPAKPIVPASALAGYSGTPLPKKLGIKAGSIVALTGAPEGFEGTLGDLPERTMLHRAPAAARGARRDLTLWFITSRADLDRDLPQMKAHATGGGLWICWPKKASGLANDLSQNIVRQAGLDAGLVDFKVCAIDQIWSGLRFSRRSGS